MKNWIKRKFESYNKPTPAFWRRVGDTLLLISSSAMSYSALTKEPKIGITIALIGVMGKFLTNFFAKDESK